MNDPQSAYQAQGYDGRDQHGRDRREEYQYAPQPQSAPVHAHSPPASASPFAFAPPPLSSSSRPPLPLHHSEPLPGQYASQQPYYAQPPQPKHLAQPPPMPAQSASYPSYASSAPMGYRSYSNEAPPQRSSPQSATLTRTPSLQIVPAPSSVPSQASPASAVSPYPYPQQRQVSASMNPYPQQRSPYAAPYYVPQAADMPRSLSYPSYAQPYPSPYHPAGGMQMSHIPPLLRHNTTQVDGSGLGPIRPTLGYSFASRLPLSDRPFKCDECVQSFNRNHDLKRHKRIHLAVKPFGCDKCGKTFSRKDALRRHWLVKGCRGEDGATAPIIPMFPVNMSRLPPLSPPTPPHRTMSSDNLYAGSASVPAPLNTLPPRRSADQGQIIVTPDEVGAEGITVTAPLDEPLLIDPSLGPHDHRGSASSGGGGEGYFEGAVQMKADNSSLMETSGSNSPYSKYPISPSHGYARDNGGLASPSRARASPTTATYMTTTRSYSPSNLGPDGKPVFAMPWAPSAMAFEHDGNLLLPGHALKMEKQGSSDGADPATWQRWHRPSFPFPPPPGVNYNFDPSSPVDMPNSARASFSQ